MVFKLFTKIFGSNNDRILKKIQPLIDRINALETDMQALSDEDMPAKTEEFKTRFSQGETLNDLLARSLRPCPGSLGAHPRHAPL